MAEESLIRLSIVVSPSIKGQQIHIQMAELVHVVVLPVTHMYPPPHMYTCDSHVSSSSQVVLPVTHPRAIQEGDNWEDLAHILNSPSSPLCSDGT